MSGPKDNKIDSLVGVPKYIPKGNSEALSKLKTWLAIQGCHQPERPAFECNPTTCSTCATYADDAGPP